MEKKNYETPCTQVIELEYVTYLLAESGNAKTFSFGTKIESAGSGSTENSNIYDYSPDDID